MLWYRVYGLGLCYGDFRQERRRTTPKMKKDSRTQKKQRPRDMAELFFFVVVVDVDVVVVVVVVVVLVDLWGCCFCMFFGSCVPSTMGNWQCISEPCLALQGFAIQCQLSIILATKNQKIKHPQMTKANTSNTTTHDSCGILSGTSFLVFWVSSCGFEARYG